MRKSCLELENYEVKRALVEFSELKAKIKKDIPLKHLQDYLIISCVSGYGSIPSGKQDITRKKIFPIDIDKKSDIFFGNSNYREKYLKSEPIL